MQVVIGEGVQSVECNGGRSFRVLSVIGVHPVECLV